MSDLYSQDPQVLLREWINSKNISGEASALIPKVSDDVMQALGAIIATNQLIKYITKIEVASATITYIGKAAPGSAGSDAVWQILRIDTSSLAADILYAGSDQNFDNTWDGRAGFSYG